MLFVLVSLLILVPAYIYRRFKRVGVSVIFNFSIYPLVFSYFYLLVPSFLPVDEVASDFFLLSETSREIIDIVSGWTVFVFLFGYFASTDRVFEANVRIRISGFTLMFAFALRIGIFLLVCLILVQHGMSIYAVSGDRSASYAYYQTLMETYRIQAIFGFAVVACVIGYVQNRRLANFIPLIPFCVLDALVGGRGYTFSAAMVIYLSYLTYKRRAFRKLSITFAVVVVAIFASAFLRRYVSGSDVNPIFILLGEFSGTRMTGQYAFDYLNGVGGVVTYIVIFLSKFLPQFLVNPLFDAGENLSYAVVLNNQTGLAYGLAGSVVTEAIYYGGVGFAFFLPVLTSAIYVSMNNMGLIYRLPGYIFFIILSASTYNIFRSSFFMIWATTIYMFIFYFGVFLLPSAKKKVLEGRLN